MPFIETLDGTILHFIDFDLHSESLHDSTTEAVVLGHGLGCNWRHTPHQIGWLAHSRRVIAPNVRGGSGKTRRRSLGWTTSDMASDVHTIVMNLSLHRPAIVGLSMGGIVALQYALDHPADVSRLIVVDTLPGIPQEFSAIRDAQIAYIDTHTLREIVEERMAVALTKARTLETTRWAVEMIASRRPRSSIRFWRGL